MTDLKQKSFQKVLENLALLKDNTSEKSILLERIEAVSNDTHSIHNDHCSFSRDGGGHGNVCYLDQNDDLSLIVVPETYPDN